MDQIIQQLEDSFASQQLAEKDSSTMQLEQCLQVVKAYATIEHCVAVLSDLTADKSYIYSGAFADYLGIEKHLSSPLVIESKWEDEIYSKIHPDDLFERHVLELRFFHFLEQLPPHERLCYNTSCRIRALNHNGEYQPINHRTLYLQNNDKNRLWLALCLYNFSNDASPFMGIQGKIINNKTGEIIPIDQYDNCTEILSSREKEILQCVREGLLSKEIALRLHISINTVNRHRQNILEKLGVKNSMEAIQTALAMHLI